MQRLAGEDLEQDRAERVDVGRRCRPSCAAHLLGRHVAGRAEHRAGLRRAVERSAVADREAASSRSPVEHARDAPVEHVDLAEVAEHDVRRLEIAMDDAARVREARSRGRRRRTRAAARCGGVALSRSSSASVMPASRFIVKNGRPSASRPSSCTGTIAGCSRRAWIRASRRNRVDRVRRRLCARACRLIATSRPMLGSCASSDLAHAAAPDQSCDLDSRAATAPRRAPARRVGAARCPQRSALVRAWRALARAIVGRCNLRRSARRSAPVTRLSRCQFFAMASVRWRSASWFWNFTRASMSFSCVSTIASVVFCMRSDVSASLLAQRRHQLAAGLHQLQRDELCVELARARAVLGELIAQRLRSCRRDRPRRGGSRAAPSICFLSSRRRIGLLDEHLHHVERLGRAELSVRSTGVASAIVTYLVSPAPSSTSNSCESPTFMYFDGASTQRPAAFQAVAQVDLRRLGEPARDREPGLPAVLDLGGDDAALHGDELRDPIVLAVVARRSRSGGRARTARRPTPSAAPAR